MQANICPADRQREEEEAATLLMSGGNTSCFAFAVLLPRSLRPNASFRG